MVSKIANKNHQLMSNGERINSRTINVDLGAAICQGLLALPILIKDKRKIVRMIKILNYLSIS
jgi:hypothetical protein